MLRLIGLAIPFCLTLPISGWQEPVPKPNFSGSWQLDITKSKTDVKEDLVWKIDQKSGDIAIEEIALGKSTCTAKCALRSSDGSRRPWRFGLKDGDAVSIRARRIGESAPVAIERRCRAGRTKQAIQARQSWALTFSLEGRELHSESDILEGTTAWWPLRTNRTNRMSDNNRVGIFACYCTPAFTSRRNNGE